MGLLNLTLGQLLAVFLPLAGMLVALYFYDRSRRRVVISTLRFWPKRPAPPVTRRHKKLQQPLSLLLQLLAMLLLLLAIADLRFGISGGTPRHHVIVLDSSSAMGRGNGAWMEAARQRAIDYLRAIPSGDRVLLIRAEGLPTPATAFTEDHAELRDAIEETQAGWTALNLDAALELARTSLALALDAPDGSRLEGLQGAGEIAYIGPGRLADDEGVAALPHLRYIEVGDDADDAAIRRFSARRAQDDAARWEIRAELWNESAGPRSVKAAFYFEDRKLGERSVDAPADGPAELEFRIRTEQAGELEARLELDDDQAANNRASLALPAAVKQPVRVYTNRQAAFAALLGSTPNLEPRFSGPEQAGELRLVDRAAAPDSAGSGVYLAPDPAASPIPVKESVRNAKITSWNAAHPLGAGLREADVELSRAMVLEAGPNDVVVASVEQGPVAVARSQGDRRVVVIGFDPLDPGLANRLTTPLLFANIVRWFAPEVFRVAEFRTESPGSAEVDVTPATRQQVEVEPLEGRSPAWVWSDGRVRLFSRAPSVSMVRTPYDQVRLAMTLPQMATARWQPPADVLRGIPPAASQLSPAGKRIWPWLALLALAILAYDWAVYGRGVSAEATTSEQVSPGGPLGLGIEPSARTREREEALR
jgi:hypothetical protein